MHTSLGEKLTAQFYKWEQRGRGWAGADFLVELEPAFTPFFGHFASVAPAKDDSKRHTLVSGLLSLFTPKEQPREDMSALLEMPPVQCFPSKATDVPNAYKVVFPEGAKVGMKDMQPLLLMLSYTEHPVSFEMVCKSGKIIFQYTCHEEDEALVHSQVKAYYPAAMIAKDENVLDFILEDIDTCIFDFGIKDEFMRPIRTADELDHDPYVSLCALFEQIGQDECGAIQILFKGTQNPWAESIIQSVTDNQGGSFFEDDPEMVKLAREKISSPLFAVTMSVVGQSNSGRARHIASNLANMLTRVTASRSNQLIVLVDGEGGMTFEDRYKAFVCRQSQRLGMLLNSQELATIAHFPTDEIQSEILERGVSKTKCAPALTHGNKFILGMNTHRGVEQLVSVPDSLRLKHTHIIGATGTGKSTLFLSMVAQDMQQGNGLAVLDPHGDLIEAILARVPEERIKDVILIDPSDGDYPVAFNILSAHSEIEKDILSSDLVAAFKRLSTSWGDQMNSVFANAILAFLESTEGGTLLDLRRFLIEKPFRDAYLKSVKDPHIVYYWQHEYPLLKSSSLGSILTRLDTFLRPKLIRNMVAQKKGLNFEHIMDSRKILLVKLSQGLMGAENSFLLGTFFVSKMYQAAMARQAKTERSDFFFYIDEFHHFCTPSMSHILSGARKYHMGLILAHQDMRQIEKNDSELASAVMVNAGTRICFRLGDMDASRFAKGFSFFDTEDLENLSTGEAIARIEQPNYDFNLSTIPLPEIEAEHSEMVAALVRAKSRETYGTPKEVVEANLAHGEATPKEPERVEAIQEASQPEPIHEPFKPVEIPRQEAPKKKAATQHRYLQTLIKRAAEARGYKAIIEDVTPDGNGRVDVSLERAGKKIACEISVTTGDEWEVHNIEKCLTAGYDEVIVCSDDVQNLRRIRGQLENRLTEMQLGKILTLEPTEVVQYFDSQIVQESTTEKVVKGYRVKVEYDTSGKK